MSRKTNSKDLTSDIDTIRAALKELENWGVSMDDLEHLNTDRLFCKKVSTLIVTGGNCDAALAAVQPTILEIPITVDYDTSLELLYGDFLDLGIDINSENFPTSSSGVKNLTAKIVNFDEHLDQKRAIDRLNAMELRPGDNHELLALGKHFPVKKGSDSYKIIQLQSSWDGLRYVGPAVTMLELWPNLESRAILHPAVRVISSLDIWGWHNWFLAFDNSPLG